jgi:hypothetical protein
MTAFIIISSRLDPKPSAKRIHAQSWTLMKVGWGLLTDLLCLC